MHSYITATNFRFHTSIALLTVNLEKFTAKTHEGLAPIRKADVDNHNADGGSWIIIHDRVYDVHAFQSFAPCGSDILTQFISKWASKFLVYMYIIAYLVIFAK